MKRYVIVWVLISLGFQPYPLGTFQTHGQCVQAKYNYGYTPKTDKRNSPPRLVCRQQTIQTQ